MQGFVGLLGMASARHRDGGAASGLHLVAPELRNPRLTSSVGTGELILAALEMGVNHLILGIGGSATNDGGAGMIQALGGKLLKADGSPIAPGGAGLAELATIDLSGLDPRLTGLTIEVACDVDNPLCGPKGRPPCSVRRRGNSRDGGRTGCQSGPLRGLHRAGAWQAGEGDPERGRRRHGAALVGLLGAELKPGIRIVIEALNLAEAVADADLVITGGGRIDSQTIHGKTPIGVARCAKQFGKPVIGIAGCLTDDCGVVHEHGLDAVFAVVNRSLPEALATATTNLQLTARNVAALYLLP